MPSSLKKYLFPLVIAVLAFVQYANTFGHDYAWDDAIVIQYNDRVQEGVSGIPSLFLNYKSSEMKDKYGYRPVTLSSFALDISLFGMNPSASHIVNALLYALLCLFIWFTIRKIFPDEGPLFAFLVGIIFANHPLHVEVVANIKSRDEILAMLFGLLSLRMYLKGYHTKKILWLGLSFFLLIVAFLAKESALFLLPVLPLALWFQTGASFRENWKWYLLPFAGVAAIGLIYLLSQSLLLVDQSEQMLADGTEVPLSYLGNALFEESLATRIANAFPLLGWNLQIFMLADPLVHDYGTAMMPLYGWGSWQVWLFVLVYLGLGLLAWKGFRSRKVWSFGILFYLLTFFGYLHIIKVGPDIWAERFLFLPSLGLALALVAGVRLAAVQFTSGKLQRIAWILPLSCFAFYLMMSTIWRNPAWKDTLSLLEQDRYKLENCARANYNLGLIRYEQYSNSRGAQKAVYQNEFLGFYEKALEIAPKAWAVYNDLGSAYMELGKPERAYPVFARFKEQYPDKFLPNFQLARYHISIEQFAEAIPLLETAQQMAPGNLTVYSLLSVCYMKLNYAEEAIAALKEGERQARPDANYFDMMADVYLIFNRREEAITYGKKALELDPGNSLLQQKQNQRLQPSP